MQRKSFLVVAALAAGIAFGVVFGPSIRGTPASAQTQPPTPTPAQTQPQQGTAANSLRNTFLDKLAAALNIQRSALDSAIVSAGSSTLDEAVQQGKLTQAQADALKARLQSGDLGALPGGPGHFGGKPDGNFGGLRTFGGVQQAMVNAAAKALNMTTQELMTDLRNGQTLAQLAQAHGTTEQAVTDAALAAAKTQLDQAVSKGTLTQAQADAIYARLQQAGTQLLAPHGRGFNGGGRQWQRGPKAPQTPTTTSQT
jgi:ribosomal protein S20